MILMEEIFLKRQNGVNDNLNYPGWNIFLHRSQMLIALVTRFFFLLLFSLLAVILKHLFTRLFVLVISWFHFSPMKSSLYFKVAVATFSHHFLQYFFLYRKVLTHDF